MVPRRRGERRRRSERRSGVPRALGPERRQGVAVLHGWRFYPERRRGTDPPPLDDFTPLTRDLYIPAGDIGFWQGSFRDPSSDAFAVARDAIDARQPCSVDILYGDYQGGQRVVSRFAFTPRDDGGWLASVGYHWNIDRPAPR